MCEPTQPLLLERSGPPRGRLRRKGGLFFQGGVVLPSTQQQHPLQQGLCPCQRAATSDRVPLACLSACARGGLPGRTTRAVLEPSW